jgi:hypothetical protein
MYCPCKTDEADEIFVCSIRSNVEVSHTPAMVPVKVYLPPAYLSNGEFRTLLLPQPDLFLALRHRYLLNNPELS